MVVVTDGKPEGEPGVNAVAEAAQLKLHVERIVGIGFGKNLPQFIGNLRAIASPGNNVLEVPDIHKLDDMVAVVLDTICRKSQH